MEKRGLIARGHGDGSDGRAATIALTDEGRAAYRRAIGPHLRSAKRWFADALEGERLGHLDDALGVLLEHVRRTAESSAPAARGSAQRAPAAETTGPPAREPQEAP